MAFLDESAVVGAPAAAPQGQTSNAPFLSEGAVVGGSPAEVASRQESSTWWGSLKAAAAPYLAAPAEVKRRFDYVKGALPGTLAQLADMSTGVGAGVVRGLAFSNLTVPLMLMGKSPKEAALTVKGIGEKIPEEVAAPFATVARALGPEAEAAYKQNPVGTAMEYITKLIESGGKKGEKELGVPAEMIEQAADLMFTGLGVAGFKGAYRSGRMFKEAEKAKAAETAKATQAAAEAKAAPREGTELVPPAARPETFVEKPAQVKKIFDEAKARTDRFVPTETDVADIFAEAKGPAAQAIADSQARIAAQRRALADGTKAEEVLAQRAPIKAVEESIASGEPLSPEAWIAAREAAAKTPRPKEAPPQSDLERTGLWKIARGEQTKLTPEEYIAARNHLGEKGTVDPELLKLMAVTSGSLAAAFPAMQAAINYFYPEKEFSWTKSAKAIWERFREKNPMEKMAPPWEGPPIRQVPTDDKGNFLPPKGAQMVDLALPGAVAGMVLGRKGMPHPALIESLSLPLKMRLANVADHPRFANDFAGGEAAKEPLMQWADKAVARFLQKPKNEIADVEIPFGEGTKPLGELLESVLESKTARELLQPVPNRSGPAVREVAQSLLKIPADEPVWRLRHSEKGLHAEDSVRATGALKDYLSHVGDYLAEHVPAAKLGQFDLVRAVRETVKWDKELAKRMEEARLDDTKGSPVYKDYGDGMRWVQLTKPGQFARESDAMGHSVRGYEPPMRTPGVQYASHPDWIPEAGDSGHPSYGLGGWEAIKSGEAKIYSLRDAKGESHATIEVQEGGRTSGVDADGNFVEGLTPTTRDVVQIKGKQNRAPAERYLPYVQDFVKGGKWGEVGDLDNSKLVHRSKLYPDEERVAPKGQEYFTDAEIDKLYDPVRARIKSQQGKIDPRLLAAGAGAALGTFLSDDKLRGALLGAGGGLLLKHAADAGAAKGLDWALGNLSTRLGHVSEQLKLRSRDLERETLEGTTKAIAQVGPFLKMVKQLSADGKAAFESAALKGAGAVKELLADSPAALAAFRGVEDFLARTREEQIGLGRFKKGLTDYLPRVVADLPGLLESLGREHKTHLETLIADANAKTLKDKGRPLTDIEQSVIVDNYLQSQGPKASLPGYAKARGVKDTAGREQFYHPFADSLMRYVTASVEDLAAARFFGSAAKNRAQAGGQALNLSESIGELMTQEMKAGRLTADGAIEAANIIRARLQGGQESMHPLLQDWRNLNNATLLGSFHSALTQTGDLGMVFKQHGVPATLQAIKAKLTGTMQISRQDLGLVNHITDEMTGGRLTGKLQQQVFKLGFSAVDGFAKDVSLNAGLIKNQRGVAKAESLAKFREKYGETFGNKFEELVAALQAGKITQGEVPLQVRRLAFSELSDYQAISKMENSQAYNAHPNARMLFQMKTFMLKQADIVRREVWDNVKKGNYGEATKAAVPLAVAFSLANVAPDVFKAWLSGQEVDLSAGTFVESFAKTFGINRYSYDKVIKNGVGGFGEVVRDAIVPPWKHYAEMSKLDEKLVKYAPGPGKLAYDRFLGGNERKELADQLRKNRESKESAESPEARADRLSKLRKERLRDPRWRAYYLEKAKGGSPARPD